jgi:pyridoxamine 5'-phosphate oxidase
MKTENIQKLREDYSQSSLDESDVNQNPIKQFEGWLNASIKAKLPEPNAMTLSTVDSDHKPHSRIILLKGIEEESFIFYSNYGSDKGKEMEDNPNVSLCFLADSKSFLKEFSSYSSSIFFYNFKSFDFIIFSMNCI